MFAFVRLEQCLVYIGAQEMPLVRLMLTVCVGTRCGMGAGPLLEETAARVLARVTNSFQVFL